MPVPDFSPGEVLTAGHMDSVGLWRVASGTLAGATTDFVGCFSSNFDNYRIVIDRVAFSGTGDLFYRMLTGSTPDTTSNYFHAYNGLSTAAAALNSTGSAQTSGYIGISNNGANSLQIGHASFDIYSPNIAQRTFFVGAGSGVLTDFYNRTGMTAHNVLTAFTGLRLTTNSAVTVTGNVTIYGYRKP